MRTCGALAGLAVGLALLLQAAPGADAQEPPAASRPLAAPVRRVTAVVLEGCQSLSQRELMRAAAPLSNQHGTWTAPGPGDAHREVSLGSLGRGERAGALIDARGVERLADAVADRYARAGRPGTLVEAVGGAPSEEPGLLVLYVREAAPSQELERVSRVEGPPARVAEFVFRGVSGHTISLAELRAVPLALARVPDGYVAPRESLPTVHICVSDLERPHDLPISLYPSALQQVLDAVGQAYRDRGVLGVRAYVPLPALRRTFGAQSRGILEIHVSEP